MGPLPAYNEPPALLTLKEVETYLYKISPFPETATGEFGGEMQENNTKFKVGDKVAIFGVLYPNGFYCFDEIDKISPSGLIRLKRISGAPYKSDGQIKSRDSHAYFKLATPELRKEIQDRKDLIDLRTFVRRYSFNKLELPQLRELKALLDKFEAGKRTCDLITRPGGKGG